MSAFLITRSKNFQRLSTRFLHIKTLSTPNENALKFISTDGELLQDRGSISIEVKSTEKELFLYSPLVGKIFTLCSGVKSLMVGDNFLTVNKDELSQWDTITPIVIDSLTHHLASGKSTFNTEFFSIKQDLVGYDVNTLKFEYDEDAQEISDMIEEIIQTRIRPAIMDDGGDIQYRGWNPETGIVYLKLQGACKSCSSSEDTLKYGIRSMLKHYIEEVNDVVQVLDPEEEISLSEFQKFENKLQKKKEVITK